MVQVNFLKKSAYERSDAYELYISDKSGLLSVVNESENKFICQSSDGPLDFDVNYQNIKLVSKNSEDADIVKVKIPYNTNLLIQECMAMGISMRMIPENVHNYEKLDVKSDDKFVLQDSDLRNMLSKKTKVRKIKKTDISTDKFLNKVSNNKIVVKNIGEDVTENDIEKLFSETGVIFDVKITEDSYTNNKAIIVFKSSEQAKNSINKFNGEMLDGRKMNIELFTEDFNKYPVFVKSSEKSSEKKVSFVKPSYTEKFVQEDNPYDFSRFEEKEKEEEGPVYTPGSPSCTLQVQDIHHKVQLTHHKAQLIHHKALLMNL